MVSALTTPRPILKNQAIAPTAQPVFSGVDLSDLIAKRNVLMQIHKLDWNHPRMIAYLDRCNAPSKHYLTEKQLLNLVKKLENLEVAK